MNAAPTLADAVADFVHRIEVERGLSAHTVAAYERDLAQFVDFCDRLGTLRVDEVTRRAIRRYMAQLTTRGYSRRSVARKLSAIRSFFTDAARRELLPANPAEGIRQPKRPAPLPKALPAQGLANLLDSMDGIDFSANCPHGRPALVELSRAEIERWFHRR